MATFLHPMLVAASLLDPSAIRVELRDLHRPWSTISYFPPDRLVQIEGGGWIAYENMFSMERSNSDALRGKRRRRRPIRDAQHGKRIVPGEETG